MTAQRGLNCHTLSVCCPSWIWTVDFYLDKLFHYTIKAAKCVPVPGIALPKMLDSLRKMNGKSREQFWVQIAYVNLTL